MAEGPSESEANAFVNGLDGTFMQLHTAAPGAAGTANIATETDRQPISLAAAAGGSAANDADIVWNPVDGSEDPTHYTLHSAASGGTFRFSGPITSAAYVDQNIFRIDAGDLVIAGTVAS